MGLQKLTGLSDETLRQLPVADKFRLVFKRILLFMGAAIVTLSVTLIACYIGLQKMYNTYYKADNLQGEIRIDVQALSKAFLWALSSPDEEIRAEQLSKAMEKFGEFTANLDALSKVYKNEAVLSAVRADLGVVEQNGKTLGAMFTDGSSSEDIFFYFNDVLYPSINVVVQDFKSVSSTIAQNAERLDGVLSVLLVILMILAAITVVIAILFTINARTRLTESVLTPVEIVSRAAEELAAGSLDISVEYDSGDELGRMAADLRSYTEAIAGITNDIIATLSRIAGGDFSRGSDRPELYIADYAQIADAFSDITDKLSETMASVMESSSRVSQGAVNMSQGATDLAEGATDQAAAIEEVTASVSTVAEQTKGMAEVSEQSVDMARQVQDAVETGMRKMKLVTDAMERITDVSREIEQITNSIENIANQTRLLALNASIEAARAGDMGKGFAVVAEEIGTLANDSTTAAKNTHQLISDTMDEIRNGNIVVEETKQALEEVQFAVNDVAQMMHESGELAKHQVDSMDEISKAIEQISNVVQSNSATAQESSAVSHELSEQSEGLHELIGRFIVK